MDRQRKQYQTRQSCPVSRGYTLVEILVVIALIGILAGVIIANSSSARRVTRDRRRVSDIQLVRAAYQAMIKQEGRQTIYDYPWVGTCVVMNGWDCSYDGSYIYRLVDRGYLPQQYQDPLHPSQQYTYLYEGFPGSGNYQGCPRPFYILVAFMETDGVSAAQNDNSCWTGPFSNDPRAYVVIGK